MSGSRWRLDKNRLLFWFIVWLLIFCVALPLSEGGTIEVMGDRFPGRLLTAVTLALVCCIRREPRP